jgi:hypothetical protein
MSVELKELNFDGSSKPDASFSALAASSEPPAPPQPPATAWPNTRLSFSLNTCRLMLMPSAKRYTCCGMCSQGVVIAQIMVMVGVCMCGFVSGSSNAFNNIGDSVQRGLQLTDAQISLLTGLGLVGTQFTLPAGFMIDKVGVYSVCLISATMVIGGYVIFSCS